jgi:hypothetical protein
MRGSRHWPTSAIVYRRGVRGLPRIASLHFNPLALSTPPVVDAVLGKYAPVPTTNGAGQVVQPAKGKTPAAIGLEDFDLLKVIGKGSFGKVRLLLVSDN